MPQSRPAPMQTVARIHWLGMDRISRDTNAASLMAVWNLPESYRLEQQTLEKLSVAPWPLLHRNLDTNAAPFMPRMLSGLLDDVVSNECFLEIQGATSQPDEMVLAIRLDDSRAALWQTNLARVLESLTGIQPVSASDSQSGWSLKKHHAPNLIELDRAGGWTLLGAAEDHNGLLDELRAAIQGGHAPFTSGNSNDWIEAEINPALLASYLAALNHAHSGPPSFDLQLSTLNHFDLTVTGDGSNVLAQGTADFSEPLTLDLKPWNIPTNLIDERLSSFTLIRGFQPWLASLPAWTNLDIGPPPDQACFWAEQGLAMLSYFTAPLPGARSEVDRFSDWLLQNQFHWYPTNGLAQFEKSGSFDGLDWKGLPYMSPFLRSISTNNQNYIYGGGFPNAVTQPLSLHPLQAVLSRNNLLYHDWEITAPRIDQWLYMGQFARYVSHKAQLPFQSPGLLWLKAIGPKLGMSLTDITQSGPNQLSFARQSTIGLTAVELNLLADWLESPQFPGGLYSLSAPPPAQP